MKKIYYFITIISLIGCDDNLKVCEKKQLHESYSNDSIYKIKGKQILDSLQPIIDFKLKSGGFLTAKDASAIYYADTTKLENLLNFGIALYRDRHFNQSYWFLNNLIKKDSSYKLEVYFQKSQLWDIVPNNDSSLFYINKTIELSPKTAMFYYFRARIYENNALYQKAVDDINKAIKFAPKNENLIVYRGYMKIGLEDYIGALNDLKYTPKLMKNDYAFYANRALVVYKLNSFEECIEQCNICIKLNPKIGNIYTLRGQANIQLGKNEAGLEDYKKATELGDSEGIKSYNALIEYLKTHKEI